MNPKKIRVAVELHLTEDAFRALEDLRKKRGLATIDDAISVHLGECDGLSPSTPTWTEADILAIATGQQKVLKTIYAAKTPLASSEIATKLGIDYHVLKGYLAQLTLRYKKLGKEPLHLWNGSLDKYGPNPRYQDLIQRLL